MTDLELIFNMLGEAATTEIAQKRDVVGFEPNKKAAHNASFDRGVLHACCGKFGITPPSADFLCTMKLSRRVWGIRPTKLSDVCRHFNIPLQHHDAASDALACAKIVLEASASGIPVSAFLKKAA
jgi:DNA polymerase III epsilon subunit-like protein